MKNKKQKYSEKLLEELREKDVHFYVYRSYDYIIDVSKIKTEFKATNEN